MISFKKAFLFTCIIIAYRQLGEVFSYFGVNIFEINSSYDDFFLYTYPLVYIILILLCSKFNTSEIKKILTIKKRKKIISISLFSLILVVCICILIPTFLNFALFIYRNENIRVYYYEHSMFSFFSLLLFAPVLEELFFRRIIAHQFFERYGYKKALYYSAILFAIMHIPRFYELPMLFVFGILVAYIYLKTKNIYIILGVHFANNLYCIYNDIHPKPISGWFNTIYFKIPYFWIYYTLCFFGLIFLARVSYRYINNYYKLYVSEE